MNPVAEQIDERILRLLGLEDVFDLDYDTYMTLLREAMVRGANRLPQEELALLANERKRIRDREGRFTPTPKKITVDSISGIGNIVSKKIALPGAGLLSLSQKVVQQEQAVEAPPQEQIVQQPIPQDQFIELNQTLSAILQTVNALYDLEIKKAGEASLIAEKRSRRSKEESAESNVNVAQKASDAFSRVVAPFQSILDRIFGFVKFIFLGKTFLQLVEWLKDPSNVEKIQSLGRFLKDFWPLLLALYIRPLRSFIFKITGSLLQFSGRLASKALSPVFSRAGGLLSKLSGRLGLKAAGKLGSRILPGAQTAIGLGMAGYRLSQGDTLGAGLAAGSAIPGPIGWGFLAADVGRGMAGYASGGLVSGEKGVDKVPAMLTEGEVVINKKTVDAIGAEVFLALNRLYGGPDANKPKMMMFNSGGMVGKENSLINQKALHIYNRLISKGLTSIAAMGIVSNIGVETGYTYDPSTMQQGGGPGRGLVQWEQGGRYDTDNMNLVSFAESRRKPWNDLNTQIDFIMHELNNHPEFREVRNIINTAKTVQEATQAFLTRYEKAGVSHLDRRYAVGEQLENVIRKPRPKTEQKPKEKKKSPGFWESFAKMMPTTLPYKGGGMIGDHTGIELGKPPNASDTQGIAVQPGEYVLPKGTVDLLGKNLIDQLVAKTDSDSDPAKLIAKSEVNRYTPTPLSRPGVGGMMTLPPQVMSSGQQTSSGSGGTHVPVMTAQSPNGSEVRGINANIYGIG